MVIESFWFQTFPILLEIYETISRRHATANSNTNNPSEKENDVNNSHIETNTEPSQGETSVEPNTNPT